MPIVGDEKHWRSRVQDTLTLAESMKHHESKRVTLELALIYGRLADYAKRRQRDKVASAVETLSKAPPNGQLPGAGRLAEIAKRPIGK
jgi:hypothetical protein